MSLELSLPLEWPCPLLRATQLHSDSYGLMAILLVTSMVDEVSKIFPYLTRARSARDPAEKAKRE